MTRVVVIVEHDDGRVVGIDGADAVVVDWERDLEPLESWLGTVRRTASVRYRLTLEFPDGMRFYTPHHRPPPPPRDALPGRPALPGHDRAPGIGP